MGERAVENSLLYPPAERQVNPQIIKEFKSKPYTELNHGDHIRCQTYGLADCIFISRNEEDITVIGCKEECNSSKWTIKEDIFHCEPGQMIEVANYANSECISPSKTVDKAEKYWKSEYEGVKHALDFAMLCKRGDEIRWKKICAKEITKGDHLKWGTGPMTNHAIVIDIKSNTVRCIGYKRKKLTYSIHHFEVKFKESMRKAIYNTGFDVDTVLRLAESRNGERQHRLMYNNDKHFAVWCNTGEVSSNFGGRVTEKQLVLSKDQLSPGDQISWTRCWTYDHHALVKHVNSEKENEIIVYEFGKRDKNDKTSKLKLFKKESTVSIFNGYDPVYKIIHYPPEDPQVLLAAAKIQLKEGGYKPFVDNCENYAGNTKGLDDQGRGFLQALGKLIGSLASKIGLDGVGWGLKRLAASLAKYAAPIAFDSNWHVTLLKHCCRACHVAGFLIPIIIEAGMIVWDLYVGNKWDSHKATRIIGGLVGTVITSAAALGIALTLPILFSIPLTIIIVVFGTSLTNFAMRSIRRYLDRQKCREAFYRGKKFDSKIKRKLKAIMEFIKSRGGKDKNESKGLN